MPIPTKRKDEDKNKFMSRCMSSEVMNREYPDQSQRSAICMSKATENLNSIESADFQMNYKKNVSQEETMIIMDLMHMLEDWKDKDHPYYKDLYNYVETLTQTDAITKFLYRDPKTGELYYFDRKGIYEKNGRKLILVQE